MKRTPLEIICEVFNAEEGEVGQELDLRDLAGWDSLNHMNFVAAVEKEYEIMLTGDEIAEMLNLQIVNRILKDNHGVAL